MDPDELIDRSSTGALILHPLPRHTAYFTVITLNREDIGHVLGCALAVQLKEGIHVVRAVHSLRSSFIVWFHDDREIFDLSLAIYRKDVLSTFEADARQSQISFEIDSCPRIVIHLRVDLFILPEWRSLSWKEILTSLHLHQGHPEVDVPPKRHIWIL